MVVHRRSCFATYSGDSCHEPGGVPGEGTAIIPVCSVNLNRCDFNKIEADFRYSLAISLGMMIAKAVVLFVFIYHKELRPEFVYVLRSSPDHTVRWYD